MAVQLNQVLDILTNLVGFDTQNPPRDIYAEGGIVEYIQSELVDHGFEFKIYDAGDGCIGLLATRGETERLFNFHIDTVPIAPNWQRDPHKLTIEGDRAYGLGACDIKGASACMIAVAKLTTKPLALLFSTDEEHGSSVAVKTFLEQNSDYQEVLVSEPTKAEAVLAHRGIQSGRIDFAGVSGHGSASRAIADNAIHKAANWLTATLDWIKQSDASFQNLTAVPFNSGKIEGGIKANMIAAECGLNFGFRPLPGMDSGKMLETMYDIAVNEVEINDNDVELQALFFGPTLPAANQDFDKAYQSGQALAGQCGLPLGQAVDFWTEASLFSQAGMTALVYGPGDIAQAHTPDEWVALAQLQTVADKYLEILS